MRKALATLALAAVPAFAMTACNGPSNGSGVSALPQSAPQAKLRNHDFSANDLHAGGATFPAYAYNLGNQPTGLASQPQAPPGAGSLFGSIPLVGSTIYYCLTGSGTGRGIFISGSKGQTGGTTATTTGACAPLGATPTGFGARVDPPDFAGSDVALASTDYTTYKTDREPTTGTNWGEPFEMPVIAGPIVYGYRPHDFPKQTTPIQLSRWTFCAIANGTITDWNDAAVTKDNGKSVTGGVSQPVTFYFRSDGSGTSFNYTYGLNVTCNRSWPAPYNAAPYQSTGRSAAWTYGVNQTWPGPGSSKVPNAHFIGESGNPGVLAAIQATPYSTGYLEGAWAKSANPPVAQAWLGNGRKLGKNWIFVDPTVAANSAYSFAKITSSQIQAGLGSDGLPLATSRPKCILYLDPGQWYHDLLTRKDNIHAYPLMAASYLMFYGNNNGVHTSQKQGVIFYMTHKKAQAVIGNLEYTPLSQSILTTAYNAAFKDPGDGQGPCVK